MKVSQLYTLVNGVTKEVLGESAVINEDLSNVVDIGKAIFDTANVDNYVKKLVDHIGKVIFVNRVYSGGVPSVLMDGWEFGSVLEKISTGLPDAQENKSWDLTDGQDYSPNEFKKPDVQAKFFNSKVTFEIQMSFTELQLKSAFSSAEQLNGFVSMLLTSVENSMTVKIDGLIMRAINNMVAETLVDDLGTGTAGSKTLDFSKSGVKAINLLKLYNDSVPPANVISAVNCLSNPDFIRFATYKIALYSDRMTKISKLFNVGKQPRFTPSDLQNVIFLSDFAKASETFLLSTTFNPDRVTLPAHDTVPYWQGSGTDYAFKSIGVIDVKTASGETVKLPFEGNTKGNKNAAILGVICDKEAVAVANTDRRTTVQYNARAEFYNNWFKADAQYINDLNENCIVFFVGETVA
ncbi:phage major capsid protein [Herbiconiux daphne]|uniref:Major capsid protein n=1 Tax=Herbiconiux daphne TaxID=2970914 RepID=A0ABT2H9M4_9MICO|nr:hypothetical protein [Herbiconiux daphne]MCS5736572.1 hypothetical protein [Herbiconiux daphne]